MQDYKAPLAMKQLGDLFEKYKNRFKPPQSTVEKACVEVIKEVTGFEIVPAQVVYTVSTKTVSIQVPSLLKTELRLQQEKILKGLEARLGKGEAPIHLR